MEWKASTLALSWKPVYSITIDLLLLITTQIIVLYPLPPSIRVYFLQPFNCLTAVGNWIHV